MTTRPAAWYQRLTLASLRFLLKHVMRVEVFGLENIPPRDSSPLIIISNHVSLLDAVIINAFLPFRPTFLVNTVISRWWVMRLAEKLGGVPCKAIDQTNPLAVRNLIRDLQEHPEITPCIFPEGRITTTGKLMKIYDGTGMIIDKTQARILPIRIDGADLSSLHTSPRPYRTFLRPRITVTFWPSVKIVIPAELKGRTRRKHIAERLYNLLSDQMYQTSTRESTLLEELASTASRMGFKNDIVNDITFTPATYKKLLLGASVLGNRINRLPTKAQNIGLMLPNTIASIVTFFALQHINRVPAMINHTAGLANIVSACTSAQVDTILTSRAFIEKANLQKLVEGLAGKVTLVYLEDLRASLSLWDKLSGTFKARRLRKGKWKPSRRPEDPAVIMFTSGSEGAPKGVVLSHKNILTNRAQMAARFDFNPGDKVFNALPIFHSFGLTVGTLLPILEGIPLFMYPSPLHIRMVPEMIYDTSSTIVLGTDTFLSRYARYAHAYDFHKVRYVVAGGEGLKPETRQVWMDKFGTRLLEGYGTTEATPVVACNTPLHHRSGTVGKLLPAMEYRLVPVPGISNGGALHVKGDNIMLGYLKADNPGVIQPPSSAVGNGWYDTGDVVNIDDESFITILGRAKRFAKIGGEMVSLVAVEDFLTRHWPDGQHAVVTLPDERKGEKLVLVTNNKDLTRADLVAKAKEHGFAELFIPREILYSSPLPLLGSGKFDYMTINKLVAESLPT